MNNNQLEKEIVLLKQRVERLENLLISINLAPLNYNGVRFEKSIDINDNKNVNQKLKNRDKTKYLFCGKVLPKNRLVLAVIKKYVNNHLEINLNELQFIFDKSLQGSLLVVDKFENVKKITDYKKRYFSNEQDLIYLKDGTVVSVCTQWGIFNIKKFIVVAESLGYQIEEI